MSRSLEVHVPLSPTPVFLRQLWLLTESLRRFGGAAGRDALVHAWVSPDVEPYDLNRRHPWACAEGIVFHWIERDLFARHGYYGTGLARGTADFAAERVLFLDADVLIAGPLDELMHTVTERPLVCGLPAHIDVFAGDSTAWDRLYAQSGLVAPRVVWPSGKGIMEEGSGTPMPPYWNLGVIIGSNVLMRRLGARLLDALERVNRFVSTYYRCQVSFALALELARVPYAPLDPRHNFPNDPAFDRCYAEGIEDIRILHYLRRSEAVDKVRDFSSPEAFRALLRRAGLHGSNALLQRRLARLRPFPEDGRIARARQRMSLMRRAAG